MLTGLCVGLAVIRGNDTSTLEEQGQYRKDSLRPHRITLFDGHVVGTFVLLLPSGTKAYDTVAQSRRYDLCC